MERPPPWHQSMYVESGLCKDDSLLTMALESRWLPSGDTASPVMVSVWPLSVMTTSILRRSHTYNVADAACQITLTSLCRAGRHRNKHSNYKACDVALHGGEAILQMMWTRRVARTLMTFSMPPV